MIGGASVTTWCKSCVVLMHRSSSFGQIVPQLIARRAGGPTKRFSGLNTYNWAEDPPVCLCLPCGMGGTVQFRQMLPYAHEIRGEAI
jgi:hypothetical protein